MKEFIINLLYDSGKKLLSEITNSVALEYKIFGDKIDYTQLITRQDIVINNLICERINNKFNDHQIISEESQKNSTLTKLPTWIIDPIDGTMNFYRKFPFFCISIAFWENKEPKYAGVYAPLTNELFYAEKGNGATLNNNPIRVSKQKEIEKSVILMSGYKSFEKHNQESVFIKLSKSFTNMRIFSSSVLDICYVASGRCEGRIYSSCSFWDIAAGKLILEESGGKLTNWDNEYDDYSPQIIASNNFIHQNLLYIIND